MSSADSSAVISKNNAKVKPWVVLKFGGTSVSYLKSWKQIHIRIMDLLKEHRVILVLSALTQVTNRLEMCLDEAVKGQELNSLAWIEETHRRLAKEIGVDNSALKGVLELIEELSQLLHGLTLVKEVSSRLRARVCAFGERMSTCFAVQILKHWGVPSHLLESKDFLVSESQPTAPDEDKFLNAHVIPRSEPTWANELVEKKVGSPEVIVLQGFVARTQRGETCLLGRGGSDTSASLIAALFSAHHLEIWTDVYGMFSGDPRKMPHARLIQRLGSRQAEELATCGAKVLHPRCIMPAAMFGVPIEIRNTMDPRPEYTSITVDDYLHMPVIGRSATEWNSDSDDARRSPRVSPKVSPRAVTTLHRSGSQMDMGSSFGVVKKRVSRNELREMQGPPAFCGVVASHDNVLLTVTTLEMWGASGFLSRVFAPFEDFNICVDQVATSQSGISVTLSYVPGGVEGDAFQGLLQAMESIGELDIVYPVSVVTVVGRRIREGLPALGRAFEAFQDTEVLMMSASSEDVALSFVVREASSQTLVELLHSNLIPVTGGDTMFGPTYNQIQADRRRSEMNEAALNDAMEAVKFVDSQSPDT